MKRGRQPRPDTTERERNPPPACQGRPHRPTRSRTHPALVPLAPPPPVPSPPQPLPLPRPPAAIAAVQSMSTHRTERGSADVPDSSPLKLICLSDEKQSVSLCVIGGMSFSGTNQYDALHAEILVSTGFVSGRVELYLNAYDLDSWAEALESLSRGRMEGYLAGERTLPADHDRPHRGERERVHGRERLRRHWLTGLRHRAHRESARLGRTPPDACGGQKPIPAGAVRRLGMAHRATPPVISSTTGRTTSHGKHGCSTRQSSLLLARGIFRFPACLPDSHFMKAPGYFKERGTKPLWPGVPERRKSMLRQRGRGSHPEGNAVGPRRRSGVEELAVSRTMAARLRGSGSRHHWAALWRHLRRHHLGSDRHAACHHSLRLHPLPGL